MIYTDVSSNLKYMKELFSYPKNIDFRIREFKVKFGEDYADAFLIYFDGMANKDYLNRDLLRPLITSDLGDIPDDIPETDVNGVNARTNLVLKRIVTAGPLSLGDDLKTIAENVSFGECAIFIDGCNRCFSADIKGWSARGVDAPSQEASLAGPQEAFSEIIMTNLALVRKILKNPDVVAENIPVGKISKTPCAVMYIKNFTNRKLIDNVEGRLKKIGADYIFSSSDVEQLIEEKTYMPMTHTLKTERPDRAASMLAEGKVVIIVQGSPFALILPTLAADLVEATEDNYVRLPEANFMRVIRIFGMLISLFFPALFIAVMLYHQEVLPTDLLTAIAASREKVPFPIVFELVIMQLAFELIKEASIRVPNPIGSALGIIGGLILGQAAVEAAIVSPILIIIVSISGIGSFATPTLALSRSLVLLQFIYIIVAAAAGIMGIVSAAFLSLALLASAETYGMPFLAELLPSSNNKYRSAIPVHPIWRRRNRV